MVVDELIRAFQNISASDIPTQLDKAGLIAGLEPMTALTDAILAAWTAFWCAFLFARANGRRPVVLWACAFAATAVSALAGVAFHGSRLFFDPVVRYSIVAWKVVPVASGTAVLCLGSAAALVWFRGAVRRAVIALLVAEFVACLIGAVLSNDFRVVVADSAPVLLAMLAGCVAHWQSRASRLVAAGIAVVVVANVVQASSLHLGSFDHNDIYHVIQMVAMYVLYRGGVLLEPRADEASDLSANHLSTGGLASSRNAAA